MIGTGTGLAPLYGIACDALHQKHSGDIHLYHGAAEVDELYMHEQLIDMAEKYDNFYYHGCVFDAQQSRDIISGHAPDIALAQHPQLRGWKVFLCGSPEMVQKVSKLAFLSGANMQDISSDAFTPSTG